MSTNQLAVSYSDILSAAHNLQGIAHHTPVFTSRTVNQLTKAQVFFKCENFQRAGAFKFRGAYHAMSRLTKEQKRQGVVAFSTGNYAQGLALSGQILGVKTTILMPHDAPTIKLAAAKEYGATILFYHREQDNRQALTEKFAQEHGAIIIPGYDHPDIMAGQGTIAKELFEEVGPLDFLFVGIGGGGLIAGNAIAAANLSSSCLVIGVEPEAGNDAQQSLRLGRIVRIPVPKTIADGAQTQQVGELIFPILQTYVTDIVTVTDDQLRWQMRFFAERMKMIVEPTGCLSAAAVLHQKVDVSGKKVGVILSGGNADMNAFAKHISTQAPF